MEGKKSKYGSGFKVIYGSWFKVNGSRLSLNSMAYKKEYSKVGKKYTTEKQLAYKPKRGNKDGSGFTVHDPIMVHGN